MNRKTSALVLVSLLVFAGLALLSGLFSGLVRLGWVIEGGSPVSPLIHGPLMINGFLGTLISLERSAALEKKWAYAAPVCMAIATVILLLGIIVIAQWLYLVGAILLLLILTYLYQLQKEMYHIIMAVGGACLVTGNFLYLYGLPIYNIIVWWMGFLLLIIFSERLELNRIMRPSQNVQYLFTGLVLFWLAGITLTYVDRYSGWAIASVALILQALWLFKYDIARRTIRSTAWTRYSAVCLLIGYGWLVLAGLFGLWKGLPAAGPMYDAILHMIFLGFVFSMIFAHAPVIIPSLSGKDIPYHNYFYLPLILLHSSLLIRIMGDLFWLPVIRKSGAHTNVLAILLFLGGIGFQLVRNSLKKSRQLKAAEKS
ncbi:MAG TPA: hypothetical protein VF181_07720 [Balneolaceae bacterium]